ncbi:hypothetical protein WK70_00505 [Burkholderia cepacia]|nr:hypothetical protein WK70_00505 [Burkholderia cepacia]
MSQEVEYVEAIAIQIVEQCLSISAFDHLQYRDAVERLEVSPQILFDIPPSHAGFVDWLGADQQHSNALKFLSRNRIGLHA